MRVLRTFGIIRAMEARLGEQLLEPEDPRIVADLGAALVAQQGMAYQC